MKIKQLCKWQLINLRVAFLTFYGIICASYLLSEIVSLFVEDMNVTMGTSSAVFLFVMNIVFFHETLKCGLGNGVSRKTILISQGILAVSMAALTAVFDYVLCWFFAFKVENFNFATVFNGNNVFATILLSFAIGLLCAVLGYFMSSLNYRMGKTVRLVVYIGTPFFFFIIMPFLWTILSSSLQQEIAKIVLNILQWFGQSPYNLMLLLVSISVVLYLFSILLIRRISLKTA